MDLVNYSLVSTEPTEDDIEKELMEKLNKFEIMTDEQYEVLVKKDKSLLLEVYSVIRSRQINRVNSLKAFKAQGIKVAAIAEQISFSRRTLYNKDKKFALEFIERIQEEEEKTNPFRRIEYLKEEIDELTKMVIEMKIRDVTIESLKSEIKKLNIDLNQQIHAYKTLEDDNFKLLKRIAELEGLETKVVGMRKKSKNNTVS